MAKCLTLNYFTYSDQELTKRILNFIAGKVDYQNLSRIFYFPIERGNPAPKILDIENKPGRVKIEAASFKIKDGKLVLFDDDLDPTQKKSIIIFATWITSYETKGIYFSDQNSSFKEGDINNGVFLLKPGETLKIVDHEERLFEYINLDGNLYINTGHLYPE